MDKKILLLMLFTLTQLFPQDSNKGLVFEIPLIKTELNQKKYSGLLKIDELNAVKYSSGINVAYSWRVPLPINTKLEIRPGVFLGDLDLLGINLGIYFRTNLFQPAYATIGIKTDYNFGYEDSHITWGRKSENGFYFCPIISLGMPVSKNFSVMIGYSYYLRQSWRQSWSTNYSSSISTETIEKLNWQLFLGIEINNFL